jgi:hypothetical protein
MHANHHLLVKVKKTPIKCVHNSDLLEYIELIKVPLLNKSAKMDHLQFESCKTSPQFSLVMSWSWVPALHLLASQCPRGLDDKAFGKVFVTY